MKKLTGYIPNTITVLNLVAGSVAIVLATGGNPGYAGIFILIAAIFDFFDGFTARILKAYSETGKQLDSLADVVSFGVAPGIIAFILMRKSMTGFDIPLMEVHASVWSWLMMLVPFMIPAFSALRLAKFNLDTRQSINFLGLPTPANALLWASFGMITEFPVSPEVPVLLFTPQNLLITIIVTSILLVSELPMFSLKFTDFSLRDNLYRYIFLLTSLLLLIVMGIYGLTVIILLYMALSISFYILKVRF